MHPACDEGEKPAQPLWRQVLNAFGFGLLSLALGLVQFRVPGVEGSFTDLREVGLLIGVFHLRHWWLAIIPATVTSLATPETGSLASTMAIQCSAAVSAWFAHRWLVTRALRYQWLGLCWFAFVAAWYVLLLLPVLAVTNWTFGLISLADVPSAYGAAISAIPYELVTTAAVSSLYLTTQQELQHRRRAEFELRAREQWIASVLRAVPVAVTVLEEGRITYSNPQLATLVGKPTEELEQGSICEFLRPQGADADGLPLRSTPAAGDFELLRADGQSLNVVVRTAPLSDSDDSRIALSLTDVTERTRLERQLRHAQRMDALGRLAASIAHDFNNMLTVISFQQQDIARRNRRGRNLDAPLADLAEAVEHSKNVIHQLLSFAKKQPFAPKNIDLGALVNRSVPMMSSLVDRTIETVVHVAPNLDEIRADPTQVEQILMNLLINARDAIDDSDGETRRVEIRVEAADNTSERVWLSVRDTGIGMDEETRSRIFEPFFTTKPEGKGTGLGLATVYGIAEQHGATLEIESEPSVGTCFRIGWPVALSHSHPQRVVERTAPH